MFANVSEISAYVVCPRLCYFRMRDKIKPTELNAVKEIYLSRRKGFDESWAFERFSQMFDDEELFRRASENFKFDRSLERLKPVDWEIRLKSEKIRLRGILDELVEYGDRRFPLVLSLRSPKDDVWFRDRIKLAAFCMLLKANGVNCERGFVYHCFDGKLRAVEIGRKDRYYVLKLIERVLRLKKGFVPEKTRNTKICEKCDYMEVCSSKPSTFASKFL